MKILFNNWIFRDGFTVSFRGRESTEKSKIRKRFLSRHVCLPTGKIVIEMTSHFCRPFFIFFTVLLFLFANQHGFCSDKIKAAEKFEVKTYYQLLNDFKIQDERGFFDVDFTPRKIKSLIFSTIIPGSGQTYLGSELKGMGISLAFYGTALSAIIAHNNAQGREDRIKVLTQEYNTKGNFNDAEKVWKTLLDEKANRDNDYDRRSLFSWLAAGVWVYNIVDVIFLTDDQGENEFSLNNSTIDINLVTQNDFNGVALKLNLP